MLPSRSIGRLREMFYCVVRRRWQRSGWIYKAPALKPKRTQPRVIIRPPSQGPMILPFRLFDREFIDTGVPRIHKTLRIELPILIAVRTKPISRIVVIFVGETHCDPVAGKSPQLLD